MEKYIQVMQQSSDLTETMLDGLKQAQRLFGEGQFEQAVGVLEQVIASFASVEKAISPIKVKLEKAVLDERADNVVHALNLTLDQCEAANYGKVQEMLQFTLIPQVQKWQKDLLLAFQPYTAS